MVFVLVAMGAVVAYWYGWYKPKRSVENESGITVSAQQLVAEYQANDASSNTKYLNKTLQVSGTVTSIGTNQENKPTITLASDDAFAGVFCTMKSNEKPVAVGSKVTVKGICSGMMSDVRLSDALLVDE